MLRPSSGSKAAAFARFSAFALTAAPAASLLRAAPLRLTSISAPPALTLRAPFSPARDQARSTLRMAGGGPPPGGGNMWDERFSAAEFIYGTAPNNFLEAQAPLLKAGSRILCIGEGEGRNAVFLAKQGHTVVGMDSSKVGLEKAQKLATQEGVKIETQVVDLKDYQFGEAQWDAIISIFVHLPPPLRKPVHEACVKALKPGGRIVLEGYTPDQLEYKTGGPPVKEMMFTPDMLKQDFDGLEFVHLEELVREVVEGTWHTGKAAVVQCVGVKK